VLNTTVALLAQHTIPRLALVQLVVSIAGMESAAQLDNVQTAPPSQTALFAPAKDATGVVMDARRLLAIRAF